MEVQAKIKGGRVIALLFCQVDISYAQYQGATFESIKLITGLAVFYPQSATSQGYGVIPVLAARSFKTFGLDLRTLLRVPTLLSRVLKYFIMPPHLCNHDFFSK